MTTHQYNLFLYSNMNPSCKRYKSYYPDITPVISYFATNQKDWEPGVAGKYNVVTVYGNNFYPNDVTKLDFIGPNKVYGNLDYIYYTNKQISFVLPGEAFQGSYQIQIKNVNYRITTPEYMYSNKVNYKIVR